MRARLWALTAIAGAALALSGCNTPPPPLPPGVHPYNGWTQPSYYSGGGYCWQPFAPGGPSGNACGQGAGGHPSRP